MSGKRLILERVPVEKQPAIERRKNWNEVVLGYSEEEARAESSRCLVCKKPPCVKGCPVGIDIPGFISGIGRGEYEHAISLIKENNMLPGVCGRVCPQEVQCEKVCVLGKKGEPVSIGKLERFVADLEASGKIEPPQVAKPTRLCAAVIGSGPAGLTASFELRRQGHSVTIFEALHAAGGVLTYGIPEFRLPQEVVEREISTLEAMGVDIVVDSVVGKTTKLEEIANGFNSAFIGIGAGLPLFLGVPGENLVGVYSANEFLTRSNLMRAFKFPGYDTPIRKGKKVIVVGGGNVAMDSARSALRMGASDVTIVYRRSRVEMPARAEEIEHGEEEGIKFIMLSNPVEIIGQGGSVCAVRCQKMKLGEPDESGRRRPVPVEGEFFELEADTLIVAVGTGANPLLPRTIPSLEVNRQGYILADEFLETSVPGVFAGGDIVTGAATVIEAMGAGKLAASEMDRYMRSGGRIKL
ncbi:MAG: NADPH-dependent glutamate synthase [Actinomycetota bacterium]|nr:NADPH-dependent glutamate synthase [Actinomycetota bacterium]